MSPFVPALTGLLPVEVCAVPDATSPTTARPLRAHDTKRLRNLDGLCTTSDMDTPTLTEFERGPGKWIYATIREVREVSNFLAKPTRAFDLDTKRSIRKSDCPVLPVIEFTG